LGINLVNILNFQGKFSFENELNFQESKIVEMPTRLFNATSKILMPNSTTSTKLSSELKKTRSKTTKFPKVNYFVYVDQMFVDNVEVNLGTNLDIVCYNSHGNVNGTIFWSRDELDSQEKLTQNRTSFNSHMLRIRYFRKEDSGYYICTVVEENGEHKKVTIKLTENASTFISHLDYYFQFCYVINFITDKKRPEASSTRTNSILNDGSSADHQEVSHTNSSILTKVTSPRLPIKVNVQPKRQWVDFHDFVEFKCIVEFPYLFENLKLKWNHNYVDLKIKKSINESNLRLAFVTENDGGDYTCTVTDENGNKYEDTGTLIVMGLAENTEKSITQVNFMTTPARFSYSIWKKSTLARVNPGDKHSAKDFSFNARVKEGDSFTFSCEKYLTSDTLKFEKFDNKLLTWLQIDQVEKNGNVEKIV
jgi:hypothetical protein